jgi:hypothetical protein
MTLADLTPQALKSLADRAGTSVAYLRHLISGFRHASVDFAVRIERESQGRVGRETLVEACKRCKYRRQCMKDE